MSTLAEFLSLTLPAGLHWKTEFASSLARFKSSFSPAQQVTVIDFAATKRQHFLSERIVQMELARYMALRTSQEDRARMMALQERYASDWLRITPNRCQGLHLDGNTFTAALQFRFGDVQFEGRCPINGCDEQLDRHGYHASTCRHSRHRIRKHDGLIEVIADHCRLADMAPALEVAVPGARPNHRPADIELPRFNNGLPADLDLTIVSPLQQGLTRSFHPLAVSSYGGWGSKAVAVFDRIIGAESNALRLKPSVIRRRLYGALSIRLARFNAWAIIDRRP